MDYNTQKKAIYGWRKSHKEEYNEYMRKYMLLHRYCKNYQDIENYEAAKKDNFKGWDCHHRAELCYSRKELIEKGDYFNVPPCNLIFMKEQDHIELHKKLRNLIEK